MQSITCALLCLPVASHEDLMQTHAQAVVGIRGWQDTAERLKGQVFDTRHTIREQMSAIRDSSRILLKVLRHTAGGALLLRGVLHSRSRGQAKRVAHSSRVRGVMLNLLKQRPWDFRKAFQTLLLAPSGSVTLSTRKNHAKMRSKTAMADHWAGNTFKKESNERISLVAQQDPSKLSDEKKPTLRLRRLVLQLAGAMLATPMPLQVSWAETNPAPLAVAVVAGGFLIPAEQYQSYSRALEGIGCATLLYADESTLSKPQAPTESAHTVLDKVEARATLAKIPPSAPLVLIGHSRGCKTCIAAAAQSQRRVAALVLLDPVDKTDADPSSVLPELGTLRVPAAVLGSGLGSYDCAPSASNYKRFVEALEQARTPRLVGLMGSTGHMQFVDNRQNLFTDVCTFGEDRDGAVREVARSLIAAWVRAALEPGDNERSRIAAARRLRETTFEAQVEWSAEDL